ncbi:ABC transporter permease [Paenibacillus turpanensis]|uniref:ABC transporter permease n=1 Tax=Paenibacillus turpanensis TaxID=2689078 RepID=UPI00140CBA57|nr:ABC transporter permease [Paenibacillus turpanensis]
MNRRLQTVGYGILCVVILLGIVLTGWLTSSEAIATHLDQRNLAPSLAHPFGTDWLGRDMFTRTAKGLLLSIGVGVMAAASSSVIALALGAAAGALGGAVDRIIRWVMDLFLSVPHLISLILISFIAGGGVRGIVLGIAFTHWPSLSRLIRAEILQLRSAEYVQASRRLGRSRWWVVSRHMLPHVAPQFAIGLLLIFPHAILHEAALTFLGMGLSPHQPAIGVILSESMRYLSTGMWWLAFFPGLCLLLVVRLFDRIGENVRRLADPRQSHE